MLLPRRPKSRRSLLAPALGLASLAAAACSGEAGPGNPTTDGTTPTGVQPSNPDGAANDPSGVVNPSGSSSLPSDVGPSPDTSAGGGNGPPGTDDTSAPGDGVPSAGGPDNPSSVSPDAAACETADVSPSVLRRLSRLEYQLTLKELFKLPTAPDVSAVPEDSDFKGFRTLAALQNVTTEHLRGYQSIADSLATQLLQDAERLQQIVGCDLAASECLESFITNFGRVAYRRTLGGDEVEALLGLATEIADSDDGGVEAQFKGVLAAMLSSASFLFRFEGGDGQSELSPLSGEELAARLSFTLIGRGPSAALLDRGAAGELDTEAGLLGAAQELLADERSREFFDAFFQQWLDFEELRAPKEPQSWWNDALMVSMQEETQKFLREYAWEEGVNFLDSITANHSYIRADLAEFYRLPTPAADGYVEFPPDHDRANSGLLSHAALVSAKSDADRIAHRGTWVQRTFLCVDLEVPTQLLDAISDELSGLSYQQMLDKRNTDTACGGCHAMIDPIGVGFSAYDEAGRFDPQVDVHQYGITPALPGGQPFTTLGELAAQLRQRAELAECVTEKLFLYTDGREAAKQDGCAVSQATEKFVGDQYRFASILEGLVASPQFRLRRAPSAQGETP